MCVCAGRTNVSLALRTKPDRKKKITTTTKNQYSSDIIKNRMKNDLKILQAIKILATSLMVVECLHVSEKNYRVREG